MPISPVTRTEATAKTVNTATKDEKTPEQVQGNETETRFKVADAERQEELDTVTISQQAKDMATKKAELAAAEEEKESASARAAEESAR